LRVLLLAPELLRVEVPADADQEPRLVVRTARLLLHLLVELDGLGVVRVLLLGLAEEELDGALAFGREEARELLERLLVLFLVVRVRRARRERPVAAHLVEAGLRALGRLRPALEDLLVRDRRLVITAHVVVDVAEEQERARRGLDALRVAGRERDPEP